MTKRSQWAGWIAVGVSLFSASAWAETIEYTGLSPEAEQFFRDFPEFSPAFYQSSDSPKPQTKSKTRKAASKVKDAPVQIENSDWQEVGFDKNFLPFLERDPRELTGYMREHSREIKCAGYEQQFSALPEFCKKYQVGDTGFVQATAICTRTDSKNRVTPFTGFVTCSAADCEKDVEACRKGKVSASQLRSIVAWKSKNSRPSEASSGSSNAGSAISE